MTDDPRAESKKFEAGATVRLKSGGPLMTVRIYQRGANPLTLWCVWFSASHEMREGLFAEAMLVWDRLPRSMQAEGQKEDR